MGVPAYRMTLKRALDSYTVSLSGEIDYAATLDLHNKLDSVIHQCENELRFDLGDVTLIDSEGLKLLILALERMREKNGSAKVIRLSKSARRLMTLSGAGTLFGIE